MPADKALQPELEKWFENLTFSRDLTT